MAKVKLNPLIAAISGKMGDFYFRKSKKKGEVVLAACPKKPKKPSKAQKAHWDQLTEAADYATAALADPELYAYYEAQAAKQHLQPRNVAISDYFKGKNLLARKAKTSRAKKGVKNNGKG